MLWIIAQRAASCYFLESFFYDFNSLFFKANGCGCLVLIINILIRISISKQLLRTTLIVCKINSLQGPTDCIYYALEIYLLFIRHNWHWKLIFIRASLHESSRRLLNVTECCFCFCRFWVFMFRQTYRALTALDFVSCNMYFQMK